MRERTIEERILEWIRFSMKQAEMNVALQTGQTGINMSYHFIDDYVGVDIRRVQEAGAELAPSVPLKEYVQILTLHELGHARDRQALLDSLPRTAEIWRMKKSRPLCEQLGQADLLAMRLEEHEMNIAFEETAWQHAETMNRLCGLADWRQFYSVKAHSLQTYLDRYEKEQQLYRQLTDPAGAA